MKTLTILLSMLFSTATLADTTWNVSVEEDAFSGTASYTVIGLDQNSDKALAITCSGVYYVTGVYMGEDIVDSRYKINDEEIVEGSVYPSGNGTGVKVNVYGVHDVIDRMSEGTLETFTIAAEDYRGMEYSTRFTFDEQFYEDLKLTGCY